MRKKNDPITLTTSRKAGMAVRSSSGLSLFSREAERERDPVGPGEAVERYRLIAVHCSPFAQPRVREDERKNETRLKFRKFFPGTKTGASGALRQSILDPLSGRIAEHEGAVVQNVAVDLNLLHPD